MIFNLKEIQGPFIPKEVTQYYFLQQKRVKNDKKKLIKVCVQYIKNATNMKKKCKRQKIINTGYKSVDELCSLNCMNSCLYTSNTACRSYVGRLLTNHVHQAEYRLRMPMDDIMCMLKNYTVP